MKCVWQKHIYQINYMFEMGGSEWKLTWPQNLAESKAL